ncbi:MAG: hypothetical protein JNM84_27215 [Planctomycetes bacterium]|nr:hypothetical protein [Planctomycetota bacterium]
MKAYPTAELYRELAFLAYYLHWPHAQLLALDHGERRRWCEEVSRMNRELSGAPANPFDV